MQELTDEQHVELREDLLALRRRLEQVLAATKEHAQPVDLELPIGRVSRIDAIQQQSMAQASRRNTETRLQQVKVALTAFAEKEYGYCRDCGEPIGYRRLKAKPETPFCVNCQGQLEVRH
jgi:DnaK suppressor protein